MTDDPPQRQKGEGTSGDKISPQALKLIAAHSREWIRNKKKASQSSQEKDPKKDQAAYEVALNIGIKQAHLNSLNLANESVRQDKEERKLYANKSFVLVQSWLAAIFCLLILSGLKGLPFTMRISGLTIEHQGFELDDKVLIALIGGTTTSVIGIYFFVANYLFPKKKEDSTPMPPTSPTPPR